MPDFLMPRLSDTMEEGTINAWLKADGDPVAVGEPLVEIETDKATMVCDAELAGTLTIGVAEGETALVGAVIAWIGDGAPAATAGPETSSPDAATTAAGGTGDGATSSAASDAGGLSVPGASEVAALAGAGVKASPIARRMARTMGVELGSIAGSGPRGRVLRVDVEEALAAPGTGAAAALNGAAVHGTAAAGSAAGSAAGAATGRGDVHRHELTRVQGIIARRMVEAKTEAPEFFLTVDVDMTEAVAVRKQLKAIAGDDPVPSFNDFVVRAAAGALAKHPNANAAFVDGGIEQYSRVNVGIAVASQGSLLVPTVFDADQKSLGGVARETRRLALAGRDGTTTPADLSAGTFTVSNLGMFGIREFTAVLNAPQAGILAVGSMETRPVWNGEAFAPRSIMTMTLTCDHRVLYGADAAKFLGDIRALLEQPLALAL
jgi:pyruvate dehydrogenase E2 component (dihydrolipoamide acetyltransferase)